MVRDIPRRPKTDREIESDPLHLHFAQDALRYDRAGRLWVRTPRGTEGTVFDVFDPDHTYLGEVVVDGRVTAFAISDGYVATTGFGEFDTARVRLWRQTWR